MSPLEHKIEQIRTLRQIPVNTRQFRPEGFDLVFKYFVPEPESGNSAIFLIFLTVSMYRRKGHSNPVTTDAETVSEKKCRNAWNAILPEFPRMGQPAAVGSSPGPFALAARPVTSPSCLGIAIGSTVL